MKYDYKYFLLLILACVGLNPFLVHAQSVDDDRPLDEHDLIVSLDEVLDGHPSALRATITLKVVDLQSGAILYDRSGNRLLTPASNLKIYTSACALDCFGPSHQFPTLLVAEGPIRNGILHGNLILIGGGNAMLTSSKLFEWIDRVVAETKLHRIEGEVVVNNHRYGDSLKGPGWMWDDDPDYYNMPVTPLMVDFNCVTVRLTPSEQKSPLAVLAPPAAYPPIRFQLQAGPLQINPERPYTITRKPFRDSIEVLGHGPLQQPVKKRITMNDPSLWVQALMTRHLSDSGVAFTPTPATLAQRKGRKGALKEQNRQWRLDGVSLAETLNHFHSISENAVGEVLLHELAIVQGTEQPDWSAGAQTISQWLVETAGLEKDSFRLVDGSGLSRYNLISADSSVKLLAFMHQHRHFKSYFKSLRVYPVELKGLDWPELTTTDISRNRVSAKSGGMTGVATISGYLQTLTGRRLAFSLLANGFVGSSKPLHALRSQVWRVLVRYRDKADQLHNK
ncbi:MAG: D-alanyl-D-alanine carboxypeptidase/D-alanyl-D-alanine-endopeptidase [Pirellulales bacterium]